MGIDNYNLLKKIGAVDNESEFSTDWLARSECYMRTLRFKQANPSVGTLAICASKLQHYASCMTATDAHSKLGKQLSVEIRGKKYSAEIVKKPFYRRQPKHY